MEAAYCSQLNQPVKKPTVGPKARSAMGKVPPARGTEEPASTSGMADSMATPPPASQASRIKGWLVSPIATTPGARMIPEPITPPTTTARPKMRPRTRCSGRRG